MLHLTHIIGLHQHMIKDRKHAILTGCRDCLSSLRRLQDLVQDPIVIHEIPIILTPTHPSFHPSPISHPHYFRSHSPQVSICTLTLTITLPLTSTDSHFPTSHSQLQNATPKDLAAHSPSIPATGGSLSVSPSRLHSLTLLS